MTYSIDYFYSEFVENIAKYREKWRRRADQVAIIWITRTIVKMT